MNYQEGSGRIYDKFSNLHHSVVGFKAIEPFKSVKVSIFLEEIVDIPTLNSLFKHKLRIASNCWITITKHSCVRSFHRGRKYSDWRDFLRKLFPVRSTQKEHLRKREKDLRAHRENTQSVLIFFFLSAFGKAALVFAGILILSVDNCSLGRI